MSLLESVQAALEAIPAPLQTQKDGSLLLETKVAERKAFLSRKTLTYRVRLRVDEDRRELRFFEILKESGAGLSSAAGDGFGPGFGVKTETYRVKGKERTGTVAEQSVLFGKEYSYSFDFGAVRHTVQSLVEKAGYRFTVVLLEKSV